MTDDWGLPMWTILMMIKTIRSHIADRFLKIELKRVTNKLHINMRVVKKY